MSLSRMFRRGASVAELVEDGLLHPHMERIVPHSHLYGHQETAVRNILGGATTLVSTGTGSGKTEAFLYPIISRCLELRDTNASQGITAVIIYPMNALAEDQLGRLRELLCGTGITFGLYVGKTPERKADVTGVRLGSGASRAAYHQALELERGTSEPRAVHPPEERVTREEMRQSGSQPRILLTNVKQLELLLTRQRDVELFDDARMEFLVVDEAHTFSGAMGAETACLIRRLRAYCNRGSDETVCVATSATIADPKTGLHAARQFASRFFGVKPGLVELVSEEYQDQTWAEERQPTPPPSGDPLLQLENVLEVLRSVDRDDPPAGALDHLKTYLQTLLGARVEMSDWRRSLYDLLAGYETVFGIAEALARPRRLTELCEEAGERLGRPMHEAEVLMWLALGAAARKNERPLLRPVVHGFMRGVDGAVVTFPEDQEGPRLWLAAEDAVEHQADLHRLPVMTCTTCGQHYFEQLVADFHFFDAEPGGGDLLDGARLWPALEANEGNASRVVLLDRLAFVEDDDEEDPTQHMKRLAPVHFCRHCGALHARERGRCGSCGRAEALVELYAVQQKKENPGVLTSCVACQQSGRTRYGRYREPARPIRAVNVSDIHVLAQSMLQHAERKRLLIFADNRQDAAFQAGWMQDHARRFRLRAVMDDLIRKQGALSLGDLVFALDELLDDDDDLSRALIPEVWRVARKERAGNQHQQERKKYLRLQVLRELATGNRQRMGLEPWGRMRIDYIGITPDHPFFRRWAPEFGFSPEELADGVASLLDSERRKDLLYDPETRLFSRYWSENSKEIERGYIPLMQGSPKGIKLRRADGDDSRWVKQLISARGQTPARESVRQWGLDTEHVETFMEDLWGMLTSDLKLLVPVTLIGFRGEALPDCAGIYQIDVDSLRMVPHAGVWVCRKCRRSYPRSAPGSVCMGWRCDGQIEFREESADDYDLMLLEEKFTMVRPREHSAQVPADEREKIERVFKGTGERINVLVSTPTLELGVDIGSLDSVLMRNVPPLPANYWQRAGRAGRRHRMAVNLTYARPTSHDRAYFAEPLKMLGGLITPPSFNLKNEVMVRKHVHSTVLGMLHKWARGTDKLSEADRQEIAAVLGECFPNEIRGYLFDPEGRVRHEPFDTEPLITVTTKHCEALLEHVEAAFSQGWPVDDQVVVEQSRLRACIEEMGEELAEVIRRLGKRLDWALTQLDRLDRRRREHGTLDHEDQELWRRCDRLVKKLKGQLKRRHGQAEGIDDTYTFAVLAAEGYLPGYGLDNGAIAATHLAPDNVTRMRDWTLRRAPSLALREYIPGNLIYANGHRFAPRYFQLQPEEPTMFQVDVSNEAVREEGTGSPQHAARMGEQFLAAVPVCDVQLPHHASISDDEDYRFQLPSAVYGYELQRHEEGKSYRWGSRDLLWRRSVHMRLVNVGPSGLVGNGQSLGFPICTVCGQSRSPFIPEKSFERFREAHQERCGQPPGRVGIYADVVADALTLQKFDDRTGGYSLLEALRHGASRVLEMELHDLQLLAIGQPGGTTLDMVLYDPMPGGSGLLDQMVSRWEEVCEAALEVVDGCPAACETACIDCLLNFRNAHYHRHLDRSRAVEMFNLLGAKLEFGHDIPARLPDDASREEPTNRVEELLEGMLLRAGFPRPEAQHVIDLSRPLGRTIPDFYYEDPSGYHDGICIYLDGQGKYADDPLGEKAREQGLRQELRARGYMVCEIEVSALQDRVAMARYLQVIARPLLGAPQARAFRDDDTWFEERPGGLPAEEPAVDDDGWVGIEVFVSADWLPLAEALRRAAVPGPKVIGEGLLLNGRVGEERAIFGWDVAGERLVVVESHFLESVRASGLRAIGAEPGEVQDDVVNAIQRFVRGETSDEE
ncbi:MAG: DEAD/DEAH box helicase [Bradymonadaceae bacterium]